MKLKKISILVLIVLLVLCCVGIFSSNTKEIPKDINIYSIKMLKKYEFRGIHCYLFVLDNDTIIGYSQSDVNRQQRE